MRRAARRRRRAGAAERARSNPAPLDLVHFSVTSPGTLAPGATHVLDVWAHLPHLRNAVLERARAEAGPDIRMKSQGPVTITRGVRFDVRLRIQDLTVLPSMQRMLWEGRMANTSFDVSVPKGAAPGPRVGTAVISLSGLRIARLAFIAHIGTSLPSRGILSDEQTRCRTGFASYASKDRSEVMARVHGLRKAGVDVFVDVLNLRSGQRYEQVLMSMIDTRDVFYLFWSRWARESTWVEKEWKLALARRGIDYIDPFPLESAEDAPPPPELATVLHFDDPETAHFGGRKKRPWTWRFWRR